MSFELAAPIGLVWIGWALKRIARGINAVETELRTARWERGQRESLRPEALRRQARCSHNPAFKLRPVRALFCATVRQKTNNRESPNVVKPDSDAD